MVVDRSLGHAAQAIDYALDAGSVVGLFQEEPLGHIEDLIAMPFWILRRAHEGLPSLSAHQCLTILARPSKPDKDLSYQWYVLPICP